MTASLRKVPGPEAFDLIYHQALAQLPALERETMQRSILNSSLVWIGYEDSDILCFLGLIPPTLLSDRAYLWLYTTERMQKHTFIFVRYSQRVVQEMLREFPLIVGHCAVGNTKARRWLRWLGAEFGPEIEGKVFPFEIKAKPWPPQ